MAEDFEWSDPLLEIQATEFSQAVATLRAQKNSLNEGTLLSEAQRFNQWSQVLISKSFGRTTSSEKRFLSSIFTNAATVIEQNANKFDQGTQNEVTKYVTKIKDRAQVLGFPA